MHESGAHELQSSRKRDAADDKERPGNRNFLVLAEQVYEYGYGQDRATRAEQAEAQADCYGTGYGQHEVHCEASVSQTASSGIFR